MKKGLLGLIFASLFPLASHAGDITAMDFFKQFSFTNENQCKIVKQVNVEYRRAPDKDGFYNRNIYDQLLGSPTYQFDINGWTRTDTSIYPLLDVLAEMISLNLCTPLDCQVGYVFNFQIGKYDASTMKLGDLELNYPTPRGAYEYFKRLEKKGVCAPNSTNLDNPPKVDSLACGCDKGNGILYALDVDGNILAQDRLVLIRYPQNQEDCQKVIAEDSFCKSHKILGSNPSHTLRLFLD